MNITIYTKSNCSNCVSAKNLLQAKGLEYEERNVESAEWYANLKVLHPEARQMPQIFIDGQRVGGLAGLMAALVQLEL